MELVVASKHRTENGEIVHYTVENESYVDDYGCLQPNYVAYRKDKAGKKRLSPVHFICSQMQADEFISFGSWKVCECCGSRYFKSDCVD